MRNLSDHVHGALDAIRDLPGVTMRPGVSAGDLVLLEQRLGCHLPEAYRALLAVTNGIEVGYGFRRWLGYGPGAPIDVAHWNDPSTWKWAYREWALGLDEFLVTAIHADGHLVGCWKRDLGHPGTDPPAFLIAPIAQAVAAKVPLSTLIMNGLVSGARQPEDDEVAAAIRGAFGTVPADQLVLHSPLGFPHFSEDEADFDGAMMLPAVDSMIAKADIWRAVCALKEGDRITHIDSWTDHEGRQRLRFAVDRQPPHEQGHW